MSIYVVVASSICVISVILICNYRRTFYPLTDGANWVKIMLSIVFGLFLQFSSIGLLLSISHASSGRGEKILYSILPMLTVGVYIMEYFTFRLLRHDFSRSPYLKFAALAPYLGFVLVLAVFVDDLRARRVHLREH
jgi:hypothetical protein